MELPNIISSAEPFLFFGGKTGCNLIHGLTGTPKEVRKMGEYLNSKGFTTLGIRLAGHAIHPNDLIRTRWQDWLASVEDGIHLLRAYCDRIFLVGLSLGGILALVSGAHNQIDGIIAMSTPYSLPNDWRLKIAKPISVLFPWINKAKSETLDKEAAKNHVDYPRYPTRSIAEVYTLTKILHQSLTHIHCPVLLINSKADKTVPYEQADEFERQIPPGLVSKILIEKSGHVITEDIEKQTVFTECIKFMQAHS